MQVLGAEDSGVVARRQPGEHVRPFRLFVDGILQVEQVFADVRRAAEGSDHRRSSLRVGAVNDRQTHVDQVVVERLLFDERQNPGAPGPSRVPLEVRLAAGIEAQPADRQRLVHVVVHVQTQAELLQVIGARHPPRRFPRGLHGRQQQRDEDADDRDHHQQFY